MMSTEQDIFAAIKSGDAERVQELTTQTPGLAGVRDENGVSALMQARYHSRMDMVEAFLATNPTLDIFEATALGKRETVERLLGEEPDLVHALSPDGFPLLGYACFFGHFEVAKLLLERGAQPNVAAKNSMKVFPINSAASGKHSDIVKLLLEHGADPDAAQNSNYTSLHSAAHNGDVATLKLLLAHGADATRKADDSKTPLDMAEEDGHEEAAELLRTAA